MNKLIDLTDRQPDSPRKALRHAKDTSGASFRAMSLDGPYKGIPAGTLSSIYNGGRVPKKYRAQLGYAVPPARTAIRKDDIPSAARTLIANLDPERLAELTDLLIHHAVVQVERLTEEFGWLGPWEEDEAMANFATEVAP